MAKEWTVTGLKPDLPFRAAARLIIKTKSDEMWSYAPGTIAGEDIEELHSMRVSSRRLRAAVDVCAPSYPRKEYARYQRSVSRLTDDLGGVRDADVMLDFLKGERKRATEAELPGIDDLIGQVRQQRERLRPVMIAALAELEANGFRERFDRFIAGDGATGAPARPGE
jgi:CHAD domain-containing protein